MANPEADDLSADPALDARLTELRTRFKAVLPQRLEGIVARLAALAPGAWPADMREAFRTEVHGLAGSAGLFGFDRIGATAGELERLIMRLGRQPAASHADMDELKELASQLQAAVRAA